ncbi:hypothetical protein ACE1OC_19625 [Streptomyces sp. DSM 116496]|uniref:hypothetical protein n=1 Tax=Streptomyces stoeckheimensis TaxID=3344656 RepID=UPI0038B28F35
MTEKDFQDTEFDLPALGTRQGRASGRMGPVKEACERPKRRSTQRCPKKSPPTRELTMADLAFVVTTIAVFALVVLVAKGVAKL